jgi:hypothetical protein
MTFFLGGSCEPKMKRFRFFVSISVISELLSLGLLAPVDITPLMGIFLLAGLSDITSVGTSEVESCLAVIPLLGVSEGSDLETLVLDEVTPLVTASGWWWLIPPLVATLLLPIPGGSARTFVDEGILGI